MNLDNNLGRYTVFLAIIHCMLLQCTTETCGVSRTCDGICVFCEQHAKSGVHQCPAPLLHSYTYDCKLIIALSDPVVKASLRAITAATEATSTANAAKATHGQCAETLEVRAAAAHALATNLQEAALLTGDAYIHPNKLNAHHILIAQSLRQFVGRHVVVSDFTTDDGQICSHKTITLYLAPSHISVRGVALTGMKIFQHSSARTAREEVLLLYSGAVGGGPETHDVVRDSSSHDLIDLAISRIGGPESKQHIDPRWEGNLGVMLNHSCAPNTKAVHVKIGGKNFMLLLTKSRIQGSNIELMWDYASRCDTRKEEIVCKCSAPTCNGFVCQMSG